MIRLYNVVLKECPLDSPFAPNEKKWIAAAIAAAAALAGSAMSSASSSSTNKTNKAMNDANIDMQRETNEQNSQLAREANAQQYKMFQEQNAFNLDMWNKQNAYNDPKNEVARLLAAGINPASKFGSAAQASSITSATAPSMNVPQMQAPKNQFEMRPTDFSGISDSGIAAVNAYNASRMMQAETKNKEALTANTAIDTSYKNKSMADSLKMLHNMAKGHGWQADMAKKQLEFIDATMNFDIQMKYGDTVMQKKSFELMDKEIRYQELQADILEITKGYAHQMSKAQIAQLWSSVHQANAQIGLINANTLLTDAQREHEIVKRIGTIIDNGMKGIDFHVKDAVKNTLIEDTKTSHVLNMWNAIDASKNPRTTVGTNRSLRDYMDLGDFEQFSKLAKKFVHVTP